MSWDFLLCVCVFVFVFGKISLSVFHFMSLEYCCCACWSLFCWFLTKWGANLYTSKTQKRQRNTAEKTMTMSEQQKTGKHYCLFASSILRAICLPSLHNICLTRTDIHINITKLCTNRTLTHTHTSTHSATHSPSPVCSFSLCRRWTTQEFW